MRAGSWTKLNRLLPLLALFQVAASGDGQRAEAGQVAAGQQLEQCCLLLAAVEMDSNLATRCC